MYRLANRIMTISNAIAVSEICTVSNSVCLEGGLVQFDVWTEACTSSVDIEES